MSELRGLLDAAPEDGILRARTMGRRPALLGGERTPPARNAARNAAALEGLAGLLAPDPQQYMAAVTAGISLPRGGRLVQADAFPGEEWAVLMPDGTLERVRPVGGLERLAALLAPLVPGGTAGTLGAGPSRRLPMDEASRMARARAAGFDVETRYYHGGPPPRRGNFGTRFWSRDRDYAAGIARHKGGSLHEALLRSERPLAWNREYTLNDILDLSLGARAVYGDDLAHRLAAAAPIELGGRPLRGLDDLRFAASRLGSEPVIDGRMLTQLWDVNTQRDMNVLRAAGFDALDTGRDVVMLRPENIRSPRARFDPRHLSSPDWMAAVAPFGLLGAAAGLHGQGEE